MQKRSALDKKSKPMIVSWDGKKKCQILIHYDMLVSPHSCVGIAERQNGKRCRRERERGRARESEGVHEREREDVLQCVLQWVLRGVWQCVLQRMCLLKDSVC